MSKLGGDPSVRTSRHRCCYHNKWIGLTVMTTTQTTGTTCIANDELFACTIDADGKEIRDTTLVIQHRPHEVFSALFQRKTS